MRWILVFIFTLSASTSPTPSIAWSLFGPKDYEECKISAAKSARNNEVLRLMIEKCDTDFPARRKIGGGYYYYDPDSEEAIDVSGPTLSKADLRKISQAQQRKRENDRSLDRLVAKLAAQKQRRSAEALPMVSVVSWGVKCKEPYWCGQKILTVTLKNSSSYEIEKVNFSWIIGLKVKCEGELPTRGPYSINLRPGAKTTWTTELYEEGQRGNLNGCLGIDSVIVK